MAAATATGPLCSHRADWVARVARELLGSVASKLEAVFKASLIARAYDFARVFDNQSRPSSKPSPVDAAAGCTNLKFEKQNKKMQVTWIACTQRMARQVPLSLRFLVEL